jgi:4-diphosphocytidyl-2-C-methyl-D-erythritol kinase
MTVLRARAPGKVNLSLFVGAPRPDGLHPLASVVQPVSLADELTLRPAEPGAAADEVVCPGVEGPNLAAAALAAFRTATGWDDPPQRLEIRKRVPIAAGMGGGSGDAAAALRLAAAAAGVDDEALLHEPEPFGLVIVPLRHALSTPAVYGEFDARSRPRSDAELDELAVRMRDGPLPDELVVNDLQDAARALCPAIDAALDAVRAAGAEHALVSGSGPTVFGVFPDGAEAAAETLRDAYPLAVAARPVGSDYGAPA